MTLHISPSKNYRLYIYQSKTGGSIVAHFSEVKYLTYEQRFNKAQDYEDLQVEQRYFRKYEDIYKTYGRKALRIFDTKGELNRCQTVEELITSDKELLRQIGLYLIHSKEEDATKPT